MLKPLTVATYCMADVIANVADGITTRVYFTSIRVLGVKGWIVDPYIMLL